MRILSLAFLLVASLNAGTTGNMKVVVVDEKGAPLGGVTAIATSSALQGEQICITEDTGSCPISNLPPAADYILKVTFAEATSEKKGIEIYIDKTIRVDMTIRLDQAKGEVYQITAKAPHIDVASSTVGVNLTKGYIENVPMGRDRDFTNAMKALPSASKDVYGPAVGGATSAENQIVVDGMNSTDPKTGLSGTRLVLEFVDQLTSKKVAMDLNLVVQQAVSLTPRPKAEAMSFMGVFSPIIDQDFYRPRQELSLKYQILLLTKINWVTT